MNEEILQMLKAHPGFRERKNKNKWLGAIVLKKYGVELTPKLKDQLADLVTDLQNADRYWRLHTSEHPELQGTDYGTKTVVEQEKQLELGYSPGYPHDIRKLSTIT